MLGGGGVEEVSLDHDLGPESAGNGCDVAVWIEEQAASGTLSPLRWAIHSANPVGRDDGTPMQYCLTEAKTSCRTRS